MDLNKIPIFPNVPIECPSCNGRGEVDMSYHGSPTWEDCPTCEGGIITNFAREMTTNEKLEYLLLQLSKPPFLRDLKYYEPERLNIGEDDE